MTSERVCEDDHHLDAVALGLAKDADVLDLAGLYKELRISCSTIDLGIRLADLRADLGENSLSAHRLRTDVLHLDRTDDRRPCCRRLCASSRPRQRAKTTRADRQSARRRIEPTIMFHKEIAPAHRADAAQAY